MEQALRATAVSAVSSRATAVSAVLRTATQPTTHTADKAVAPHE